MASIKTIGPITSILHRRLKEQAQEDIKNGASNGLILFPEGFSGDLVQQVMNKQFLLGGLFGDEKQNNKNPAIISLDNTNFQVAKALQMTIYQGSLNLVKSMQDSCPLVESSLGSELMSMKCPGRLQQFNEATLI